MTLRAYELRDPAVVVHGVLTAHPPRAGDAYLVLVRDPLGVQEIVHMTSVTKATWNAMDRFDRSQFIRRCVGDMPINVEAGELPQHTLVTVVLREGLAVFGAEECEWLVAWRYSNHLARAFDGGLVLVTEHGWVDFLSERGAMSPSLPAPSAAQSAP